MFKRVEKRRRKKQEEEELGLDDEMKQVLGMHDTDSEESNSDSDDHQSTEDVDDGDDAGGLDADFGGVEELGVADEQPPITVQEALRDPLYIVSIQPVVKACVVCPGKLLKSFMMVDLHIKSNAHERRMAQFKAQARKANLPNSWDVFNHLTDKNLKAALMSPGNSKRAEKRKAYAAKRKARRDEHKAKTKAKRAASFKADVTEDKPSTSPSPKKPKLLHQVAEDEIAQTDTTGTIRSTSRQAKLVRAPIVHGTPPGKGKQNDARHPNVLKL